jgi:hypothetical protein
MNSHSSRFSSIETITFFTGTTLRSTDFSCTVYFQRNAHMKKLFVIAAAAAAIGIVTPAAAQSINVRVGEGGYHRPHHVYPRERVAVIKKHRHWDNGYHRGWRNANRGTVVITR